MRLASAMMKSEKTEQLFLSNLGLAIMIKLSSDKFLWRHGRGNVCWEKHAGMLV